LGYSARFLGRKRWSAAVFQERFGSKWNAVIPQSNG
jgi:hypothetical protein